MKFIFTILAVSFLGFAAIADHHEEGDKKGMKFEERKAHKLQMIDKRIANLNEHKACVTAAADKAAMKKCREAHKAMRDSMKEERKSWKGKFKEKMKKNK